MKLNPAEKQFLNDILEELKRYQINSEDRREIKRQLLEHFQESREHGQDSMNQLGDSATFVKDFLEINGIDPFLELKHKRNSKSRMGKLLVIGFFTLILTYLGSQLILSMFLTESFSSQNSSRSFNYNILYQISDNLWWNFLLMTISIFSACLVSVLVIKVFARKIITR